MVWAPFALTIATGGVEVLRSTSKLPQEALKTPCEAATQTGVVPRRIHASPRNRVVHQGIVDISPFIRQHSASSIRPGHLWPGWQPTRDGQPLRLLSFWVISRSSR